MTTKEKVIAWAREAGFKASVGKTDKEGNYHPDKNALSKDVPIEWLARFATLVRNAALKQALESYSPDDTASDYLAKIESLKEPV